MIASAQVRRLFRRQKHVVVRLAVIVLQVPSLQGEDQRVRNDTEATHDLGGKRHDALRWLRGLAHSCQLLHTGGRLVARDDWNGRHCTVPSPAIQFILEALALAPARLAVNAVACFTCPRKRGVMVTHKTRSLCIRCESTMRYICGESCSHAHQTTVVRRIVVDATFLAVVTIS